MLKLPNFLALRAFEAAARLGSLRKAADELHVSHTVISRHVRALESSIGVELVRATPRGITATPQGATYTTKIATALHAIAQATTDLVEPNKYPTLHVSCSTGFAVRWLAPRISDFMQENPSIEITIRPTVRAPYIDSGESDVDIRYVDKAADEAQGVILTRPAVIAVASPAWLSNCSDTLSLRNLPEQSLIHEETHAHWQLWFSKAGIELDEPPVGTRYWNAALALEAATIGHGIALAPELIVRDALENVQLVQVIPTAVEIFPYLFVVSRDRERDAVICQRTSFSILITLALSLHTNVQAIAQFACQDEVTRAKGTLSEIFRGWPLRPSGDAANDALQEIATRLARQSGEETHRRWRTHVIRDSKLNAFSIGDGHVFVTEGMLRFVESEAELAAVLSHEFAHHTAGHFCPSKEKKGGFRGFFGGGEKVQKNGRVGDLKASFDPDKEREADRIGAIILGRGGYNPRVAILFAARMLASGTPGHFHYGERIEALQKMLDKKASSTWNQPTSHAYLRMKAALVQDPR